jgi:hypothetical protein
MAACTFGLALALLSSSCIYGEALGPGPSVTTDGGLAGGASGRGGTGGRGGSGTGGAGATGGSTGGASATGGSGGAGTGAGGSGTGGASATGGATGTGGAPGTGGSGTGTGGSGSGTGGSGSGTGGSGVGTGGSGSGTGGTGTGGTSGGSTGTGGSGTGGTGSGGSGSGTGGSGTGTDARVDTPPASSGARNNVSVFLLGHSLLNTDVPWTIKGIAQGGGVTYYYREQLNIGAALRAQWEDPARFNSIPVWNPQLGRDEQLGANSHVELPTGRYDSFVMTEAIPLDVQEGSADYAGRFYDLAVRGRGDIRVYLYETWDFVKGGDWAGWRAKINQWRPLWEKIADDVKAARPAGPPVRIVPGGQAMAALYDAIQRSGRVGNLTQIGQVFEDDIHLNATGNYFMGLVYYATLYARDPSGTPAVQAGPFQMQTMVVTDAATRAALQALAWQTVRGYARSGVP